MARLLRRRSGGSRGRFLAPAIGLALVCGGSRSAAQPGGAAAQRPPEPAAPSPPTQVVIDPPIVKNDKGAVYPPRAVADGVRETIEVTLLLEIDASGVVRNASVETPRGHGFDEAALEAAKDLEFEPAKRNGQPIAAKIRHKYVFAPPPSRASGRVVRDARGAPLEGATIVLQGAGSDPVEVRSGPNGEWTVHSLAPGKYTIRVGATGYETQTYEEELRPAEETTVEMRLVAVESAPPPSSPGQGEVEEVTVRGVRPPREVTRRTLEQRELSRIPGTGGDALRAVQNLPGVARPPGLAGLLIVRGAAPQETGTFVDGTYVPIIYHFGGLSSVIPTEMIDRLDFYPGNFSTHFGRFTGGVIDVGVKNPRVEKDRKLHGLAQADFIDARVLAEGPIGNTGWNFAVGGRRSYLDVWLKPALESLEAGVSTAPVYYDYQLMLQRNFGKKHDVRFFFFGSDDRLEILVRQVAASNPGLGGNVTLGTAFYRFQARYVGKLGDDSEIRLVAAVGKDAINFGIGDNYLILDSYHVGPRAEFSQRVSSGARNNVGLDMLYQPYELDIRLPPPPRPGEPPPGPFGSRPPLEIRESDALYRPAFYDELELTPLPGTRIVPGVRVDYAKETKAWDIQPRVVGRQDLTHGFPRTTLKGGAGRFAQAPQPQNTNRVFGIPHGLRSTIANHYGLGVEQEITRNVEVSSEAFYRQYDGIFTQGRGNVGEGRAFGLETLVRYKPDARFFGFVAYTLSRSVRRDAPGEPERLFPFDQTHILTAVGSYRLGGGWEIGARFRLISGNLRTPQTYGFYDLNVGAYQASYEYPPYGARNPMFHQLDIRVDKTWIYSWGRLSAYLDLWNAYNQGNVEGTSYNYNYTQHTFATGIPILPSLGVRAEL